MIRTFSQILGRCCSEDSDFITACSIYTLRWPLAVSVGFLLLFSNSKVYSAEAAALVHSLMLSSLLCFLNPMCKDTLLPFASQKGFLAFFSFLLFLPYFPVLPPLTTPVLSQGLRDVPGGRLMSLTLLAVLVTSDFMAPTLETVCICDLGLKCCHNKPAFSWK